MSSSFFDETMLTFWALERDKKKSVWGIPCLGPGLVFMNFSKKIVLLGLTWARRVNIGRKQHDSSTKHSNVHHVSDVGLGPGICTRISLSRQCLPYRPLLNLWDFFSEKLIKTKPRPKQETPVTLFLYSLVFKRPAWFHRRSCRTTDFDSLLVIS